MLEKLCNLGTEHRPVPNLPPHPYPPASLSDLFAPDTAQVQQAVALTNESTLHGLDLSFSEATDMVVEQRINRVQAFREVYVNAYDLPFSKDDYQRLVRNQALKVMASADKPEMILKAAQLLGDTAPVQAFVVEKTININVNEPADILRDKLRERLERLISTDA